MNHWQPHAAANETIRQREGLRTDSDYRAYLQKNANSIRWYNLAIAQSEVSNFPTLSQDHVVGPPHLCTNSETSFEHGESDLKGWFFKRFRV